MRELANTLEGLHLATLIVHPMPQAGHSAVRLNFDQKVEVPRYLTGLQRKRHRLLHHLAGRVHEMRRVDAI